MDVCFLMLLNYFKILVFCLIFHCLIACDTDQLSNRGDIVIQVNDSKISLDEFNNMLKLEVYANPELEMTADNRDQFIDYVVRKELMIQEAVRLRLDRKEKFVRAIEKYWEASLIRNLHDAKAEEIKKKVIVTDNEIEAYYAQHQASLGSSLAEAKSDIRILLESQKKAAAMEVWTHDLIESADIKIDRERICQ